MESISKYYENNIKNVDIIYNGFNCEFKLVLAVIKINNFTCNCDSESEICLCSYELFLETTKPNSCVNMSSLGIDFRMYSSEEWKYKFISCWLGNISQKTKNKKIHEIIYDYDHLDLLLDKVYEKYSNTI